MSGTTASNSTSPPSLASLSQTPIGSVKSAKSTLIAARAADGALHPHQHAAGNLGVHIAEMLDRRRVQSVHVACAFCNSRLTGPGPVGLAASLEPPDPPPLPSAIPDTPREPTDASDAAVLDDSVVANPNAAGARLNRSISHPSSRPAVSDATQVKRLISSRQQLEGTESSPAELASPTALPHNATPSTVFAFDRMKMAGGAVEGRVGQRLRCSVCPNSACRQPLPVCAVCAMHIGAPPEDSLEADAPADSMRPPTPSHQQRPPHSPTSSITSGSSFSFGTGTGNVRSFASAALVWCQTCRHGGHAQHLAEWFRRKHRVCPAPGCKCRCPTLDALLAPGPFDHLNDI